jgi:hypothetical protein
VFGPLHILHFRVFGPLHILHFRVFGPLKEHFCMQCFNTDVQVQLIVLFGHQGWIESLTARICIIPSRCETNTIIGKVILL